MSNAGTKDDPWRLQTPPRTSDYEMYRDERDGLGARNWCLTPRCQTPLRSLAPRRAPGHASI